MRNTENKHLNDSKAISIGTSANDTGILKKSHTCNRKTIPTELIRATQLIGEAKTTINLYYEEHPEVEDYIWDTVIKIDELLTQTAFEISSIVGVYFRDKHFFEVGKEGTNVNAN